MTTNVNWSNPYEDNRGWWHKGNLHTHTAPASGCGHVLAGRVLELYEQRGYDFVALSDHKVLTLGRSAAMQLIPGVEWNSAAGEHTGVYSMDLGIIEQAIGVEDHAALLKSLAGREALVVLNHPNWQETPHYRREQLWAAGPYDAVEIYNGVIERLDGAAIATDKWDYLLGKGRRVLAMASDDSHVESDIGLAAIHVRSEASDAAGLLAAIRRGNFYCSTGVQFHDIRRAGDRITVEAPGAQEIQAFGHGGVRVGRVRGSGLSFDIHQTAGAYVRFTAFGEGAAMAWTQPFFLEA